jgi:gliding motility-associated-like protein
MNKFIYILFLLIVVRVSGQTILPQVINCTGSERALGSTGIMVTDNVGESFIQSVSNGNLFVTQGFLQPDLIGKPYDTCIFQHITCKGKKDGLISVLLANVPSTYTITYHWQPNNLCPSNNCNTVDSLAAGDYAYQVFFSIPTSSGTRLDSLPKKNIKIIDSNEPCKIKTYNAITPNGDGTNDALTIENISEFPNNNVLIFNRWGQQIGEVKGYDNVTRFWPSKDEAAKLNSTTYFYIITFGDGSAPYKDWVEVLKD